MVVAPFSGATSEKALFDFARTGCRRRALSCQLRNFLSLRGPFVALMPASSLRINGAAAGLKMLRLRLPMPSLPVVMITVRNRTLSRTVELFLDYMRDVANRSTSHAGSKRRNLASLSGYVFFKIGMSQVVTFMSASFL